MFNFKRAKITPKKRKKLERRARNKRASTGGQTPPIVIRTIYSK